MQKTRRLMDENSVSFQMLLILLSFITLSSKSQISVFEQCQSNTQKSSFFFFFGGGGGGGGGACAEAKIWRFFSVKKKKNAIRHFAWFKFLRLLISFYFEILSYLACGEKTIRLASKNSVNLGEKSASEF